MLEINGKTNKKIEILNFNKIIIIKKLNCRKLLFQIFGKLVYIKKK